MFFDYDVICSAWNDDYVLCDFIDNKNALNAIREHHNTMFEGVKIEL